MKIKIIGILVIMLLIAGMAIPISALNKENIPNINPISNGADVPVWEVGDSWTYNMEYYMAASPNVTDGMVAEVGGELTFEVVGDSGDTYALAGTMKPMLGTVDLPGNIDMRITRLSSYSSDLELQKTDLAILNHDVLLKGMVLLTLGPFPLPIPLQMQNTRQTEFTPVLNILPFPLNDGDSGTIGEFTVTETSEVSMFWGLIPIEQEEDLEWPIAHQDYTVTFESITVPAGTFDVYTVEAEYHWGTEGVDWFYSYYAEDIGNVVKSSINIDFGETEVTYYNIELELVSTTYEP
jgi:hypothetical protein